MVSDRDAFGLVLLLLRLKGELDEELLQFLVAVVDAKLFKAADRHNNETQKTWLLILRLIQRILNGTDWLKLLFKKLMGKLS